MPDKQKMTVDTPLYMPDPVKNMKSHCLSRRLAKEKTQYPGCNKILQVGTLAWSHRCKVPKNIPEDIVQQRLQKMRDEAARSFKRRQAQNSSALSCEGASSSSSESSASSASSSSTALSESMASVIPKQGL